MKCPHCQAENRETARFCSTCGRSIAAEVSPPVEPPAAAAGQTAAEEVWASPQPDQTSAPPALDQALNERIEEAQPLAPSPAPPLSADEEETGAAVMPPAPGAEAVEDAGAVPEPAAATASAPSSAPAEAEAPPAAAPMAAPADSTGPMPLQVGALVAERFEVVELVETQAGVNRYAVLDRVACPQCGFDRDGPEENFCTNCGVERGQAGSPVRRELYESFSSEAMGTSEDEMLRQDDRFYFLAPAAVEETEPAGAEPASLLLEIGYASHVGQQRDLDEDSLCVLNLAGVYESAADPAAGLFIVADGMGGYEGGEVASRLTARTIAQRLIAELILPRFAGATPAQAEEVEAQIGQAVTEANKAVFDLVRQRGSDMGSTVTLALVLDGVAYIANVGDSRTYIHRQGELHQITNDHSLVASLVAAGMLAPEEIFTHPERSVVYRSMGARSTVEVDLFSVPLEAGDALLLCCDGLWEAIRDEGIEEVLLTPSSPQAACNELVRRANQAGGEDNISVILVRVHEVVPASFLP